MLPPSVGSTTKKAALCIHRAAFAVVHFDHGRTQTLDGNGKLIS